MSTESDAPVTTSESFKTALITRLRKLDAIRTERVERAIRRVDRHRFVPEVELASAYADEAVVTGRDDRGLAVSSMSAPRIQAFMLEQAEIEPGMRVLEVGPGGVNAPRAGWTLPVRCGCGGAMPATSP